jgi:FkbM family methyltransferase
MVSMLSTASTATATLGLPGGVRIVVPDAPDLLTPYVLREQEDWFEDELRFLRGLLRPGEQAIDIGANYGVYALSIAHAVGPGGRVWAFEPAAGTAALLARSIAANGYTQLLLERSALADAAGEGRLSAHANTELNALVDDDGAGEAVPVTTLDDCLERHGWRSIDLVKIDAEGAEARILAGGRRFFASLSPLVLYEVRAGSTLHLDLVQSFAALGYASYRLVPGLGLLAPFDAAAPADGFLLNLFACKPERAAALASRGALVQAPAAAPRMQGSALEQALALHALSRDPARDPAERYAALSAAFVRLRNAWELEPAPALGASLARVAQEYGERSLACVALLRLSEALQRAPADLRGPLLAPGARFDAIAPGDRLGDWLLAAALEELERLGTLSSFYVGAAALPRLQTIRQLGYGSPEMDRRLDMVSRLAQSRRPGRQ